MIFDPESVNDTAAELNLTPAEVERALKVAKVYNKYHQKNKANRIAEREKMIRAKEVEDLKLAHPEACYCQEEGYEVKRLWEGDGIVRTQKTPVFHPFQGKTGEYYDNPIYRCSRCGREYELRVAYA